MATIDQTVDIVRDDEWQYVRIPLSIDLPASELHLHRDTADGPITLSSLSPNATKQSIESLEALFAKIDEAFAAGESLDLERPFSPPRDVEL